MSCSADHRPDALRPGAEQPLYQPFGIGSAPAATGPGPVTDSTLHVTPFYALRKFDLAGQPEAPRVLLVPPLSGHLPVLLRDTVLGLLGSGLSVTVIDWANVRHVAIEHGSFGFDDNIGAIVEAILHIGPGAHVLALCQGGVPALAASADLAARLPGSEPAALVLLAAPVDPMASPTPLVHLLRANPQLWYRTLPLARGSLPYPRRTSAPAMSLSECIVRVGRSGRGTSTLLRMIAGNELPEGDIADRHQHLHDAQDHGGFDAWHPARARGAVARGRRRSGAVEELVAPTGYGIVLHLTLAEEALKVLTHDLPRIEPGPAVGVPFPEGALHLFNARGVRV